MEVLCIYLLCNFPDSHGIGHCAITFSLQVVSQHPYYTLYSGKFGGRLEVLEWGKIPISIERLVSGSSFAPTTP